MKGTRYVDGLYHTQDFFNRTEQNKSESIKERFGVLTGYGIVGTSSLILSLGSAGYFNISAGEGYTKFNSADVSAEHGPSGERVFLSASLQAIPIRSDLLSADVYTYLMYIEVHKNRQLDETGAAFYTQKEDGYIAVQLNLAQYTSLTGGTPVATSNFSIPVTHTQITNLTADEKTDTFGTNKWKIQSGILYVDVTISAYNSIYLGSFNQSTGLISTANRIYFYINNSVINNESVLVGGHRNEEHSSGIVGGINALKCVIDGVANPHMIRISDLGTNEVAFIGQNRLTPGVIDTAQLNILVNGTNFLVGTGDYYIYLYYNTINGKFETKCRLITDVLSSTDIPYYMVLCQVYYDLSTSTAKAYNSDPRYNTGSTINPVIDLRKFGVLDLDKMSNDAKNEISDNLIINGNFESGVIGSVPLGWNVNTSGTGVLSTNSLGGSHSLSLPASQIVISDPIPYNQLSIYNLKVTAQSSSSSTYSVSLRGYIGKEYTDINVLDNSINIAYKVLLSGQATGISWATTEVYFNQSVSNWSWNSGYSNSDLAKIKYIRLVITGGTNIFIDNIRLIDTNGVTATSPEISQALHGISANVTATNLNTLTAGTTSDASARHTHNTLTGDVAITGSLTVNGGTTTVNSAVLNVVDANITVNKGGSETSARNVAGILIDGANVDILYDNTATSKFKLGPIGAEKEIATINDLQILTNKTLTSPKINDTFTTNSTSTQLNTLTAGTGSDASSLHYHSASSGKADTLLFSSGYRIATEANTANTIVARDISGNFSAGTITASLNGNSSGLSSTLVIGSGGTNNTSFTDRQLLYFDNSIGKIQSCGTQATVDQMGILTGGNLVNADALHAHFKYATYRPRIFSYGSSSYTPTSGTISILVEIWGGGGGGVSGGMSGGGGGGGYARKTMAAASYSFVIGGGGSTGNVDGEVGGLSSFNGVQAGGGIGGHLASGGLGGNGAGGDVNYNGGTGGGGGLYGWADGGGGGGGGGGTGGSTTHGGTPGGNGGGTGYSVYLGGHGAYYSGGNVQATEPGGGGKGAQDGGATAGAAGRIIVWELY